MTPLRRWIKKTLMSQIPIGTIWSDGGIRRISSSLAKRSPDSA